MEVTHTLLQVGIKTSVSEILAKEGARGLVLGWAPTLIGYSAQGLCKFGFYEVSLANYFYLHRYDIDICPTFFLFFYLLFLLDLTFVVQ